MRFLLTLFLIGYIGLTGCSRGTPVEEITPTASSTRDTPAFLPRETDWPNWRGPNANGISVSPTAPTHWSETENIVWKTTVPGRGHSSPVVCDELVFLTTALEDPQSHWVLAYDRATGEEKWRKQIHQGGFPPANKMHGKGSHANGTLACDDQTLFIAFLTNDEIVATALNFAGEIVWTTTLGSFDSKFGYAPSPTIYQSLVIFAADNQGGGYLAGLDRRSGEIVWRKARSRSSTYSSPVVGHVSGRDQLLMSGGYEVTSYDPNTGELLWSCEGTTDATCGTMVWNETMVFASGGYPDNETLAVLGDGSGNIAWSNRVKSYEPSMLVVGDELYAVTDSGIAHCWDATTGKLHWKKRLAGNFSASAVFCNGNIYVPNLSGTTFVFAANPEAYQEVAQNRLGDDAYGSPAICDGKVFLRVGREMNDQRQEQLYCIGSNSEAN